MEVCGGTSKLWRIWRPVKVPGNLEAPGGPWRPLDVPGALSPVTWPVVGATVCLAVGRQASDLDRPAPSMSKGISAAHHRRWAAYAVSLGFRDHVGFREGSGIGLGTRVWGLGFGVKGLDLKGLGPKLRLSIKGSYQEKCPPLRMTTFQPPNLSNVVPLYYFRVNIH